MDISRDRNVQGIDITSERKVQGMDVISGRNVQVQTLHVRGMFRGQTLQ